MTIFTAVLIIDHGTFLFAGSRFDRRDSGVYELVSLRRHAFSKLSDSDLNLQ